LGGGAQSQGDFSLRESRCQADSIHCENQHLKCVALLFSTMAPEVLCALAMTLTDLENNFAHLSAERTHCRHRGIVLGQPSDFRDGHDYQAFGSPSGPVRFTPRRR